jgi:hypothetical protein
MKGTALEDIADVLGHKGLVMTKRYAHLGPNKLHEVVRRLDADSTPLAPANEKAKAVSATYVN